MLLSKDALQMIIDLVENRVSAMQVMDREDMREMRTLQEALTRLKASSAGVHPGVMRHGEGDKDFARRKRKATYLS